MENRSRGKSTGGQGLRPPPPVLSRDKKFNKDLMLTTITLSNILPPFDKEITVHGPRSKV
jgi:hypothetical protein